VKQENILLLYLKRPEITNNYIDNYLL